jgi:hypothetical protein
MLLAHAHGRLSGTQTRTDAQLCQSCGHIAAYWPGLMPAQMASPALQRGQPGAVTTQLARTCGHGGAASIGQQGAKVER